MTRFIISTNPDRLDREWIRRVLKESYWGGGLTDKKTLGSLEHSLCFGVYELPTKRQVGFARVLTDHFRVSNICDVIIDEAYRGQGLGARLMADVVAHPSVANTISVLAARAPGFYEKFGYRHNGFCMTRGPSK